MLREIFQKHEIFGTKRHCTSYNHFTIYMSDSGFFRLKEKEMIHICIKIVGQTCYS